jgi:hypothetical protein
MSESYPVEDGPSGTGAVAANASRSDVGEESVDDLVLDAAKRLLAERSEEETPVQAWVTGSEIAHATGIDKQVVHACLHRLGGHALHISSVGQDIEVHGVKHGPGADSLDVAVDE